MIVAVPSATPVTTPLELTVAIEVFELTQGELAAGVALPVNVVVPPIAIELLPEMVGRGALICNDKAEDNLNNGFAEDPDDINKALELLAVRVIAPETLGILRYTVVGFTIPAVLGNVNEVT